MEEGLVRIGEIEGRGRAVVASKALKAGQIVLRDSPLVLYSAFPFVHQTNPSYCSHCFRALEPPSSTTAAVSCFSCSTLFCSPNCLSVALSTSHTPWSCQSLIRLGHYFNQQPVVEPEDRQVQARFLVAAYNLSMVSPSSFQSLLSLQGGCSAPDNASLSLHSLISSLFLSPSSSHPPQSSFSLELTSLLLVKEKLNAFGLMEPFSQSKAERSVRAYGIYPRASFFNHDCLPNACRFDYLDAPPSSLQRQLLYTSLSQNNADIIVRLIHDVPMGREICLSYFPVNLKYYQRQRWLQDDYGFTCDCDRCKVEANWSDDDLDVDGDGNGDDMDNNEGEDTAVMDEDSEDHLAGSDSGDACLVQEDTDFPHAYFFLRYMCDRKNCWGTLAPLPPSGIVPSSILECNVCGNLNKCDQV